MNLVTEKDIERIVHFNIKTFVHFDIDIYSYVLFDLISIISYFFKKRNFLYGKKVR